MRRAIGSLLLVLAWPALGQEGPAGWAPVPEAQLEQARGGYETASGLLVALGVQRMVEVNGVVVAQQRVDVADLARLGSMPEAQAALAPLLVQNQANGQLIRSLTTIDLTVNTLSTLKSLNLEGNLRQALSNVVVPR
ncbi:MAG: hypothetical protein K0R43_617 [Pseudoduganella sp.]|nr:hypothetical protein [Pseudoduganella sp.]